MLTSDDLTREQFLPLWREEMWHSPNLEHRSRLALEYGRIEIRENGKMSPTVVATVPNNEIPVVLITLSDVPMALDASETDELQTKLAKLASTEVFTVVVLEAGSKDGTPSFLLVSWGENHDGEQACWLQPFRWGAKGLQEAPAMLVPDPSVTALNKHLSGLLKPRH
jgi:hypothetical protein